MSGIGTDMTWAAIWLALGIMIGAFVVWSAMSKRIDAHAKNLSMAAHEVAKINPRGVDMTPAQFATAAREAGYYVIKPQSAITQDDDLGD
jgi:HAMP domain-containing protein